MTEVRQTERELIDATVRELTAEGYDVVKEPSANLLPASLSEFRPNAIALGRKPNLFVEVTTAGPAAAEKVARLQEALIQNPEWKLHLVTNTFKVADISIMSDPMIDKILARAKFLVPLEPRAALLIGWSAFEALCRARMQSAFSRPQSPGRLIERLAAEGVLTPNQAKFLREMAQVRNAFVHGDLTQNVSAPKVDEFLSTIVSLLPQIFWSQTSVENGGSGVEDLPSTS